MYLCIRMYIADTLYSTYFQNTNYKPNEFSFDYCKQNNNNAPRNFPPENVTCAWSKCTWVSLYRR